MRYLVLIILLFSLRMLPISAQAGLKHVGGLPTKEIYDLHVDSKGYLWIAHGLGLSRYDGLHFIHYTHPSEVSLRTTDIVEDLQGRIWCHNFSGQVYYIEQGRVNYLNAYDYKRESQYPRMALCGDELLVTSQWGVFICNTATLASKYIHFDKVPATGTVSLAVVKNNAVIYNNAGWYLYNSKSGMKRIEADEDIMSTKGNSLSLQPQSLGDTIFLAANPSGILHKLLLHKDKLQFVAKQEFNDYINTVTVGNQAWIHTRNESSTLDGSASIKAHNLTDVVTGKEGNVWYSSIKEGLLVKHRPSPWSMINFPIDKDDYVRSLNVGAGYFLVGTQKGNLVVMDTDTGSVRWRHNLFNGYGSIDFIRFYKDHLFLVGSSVNTYIINPKEQRIEDLLPLEAVLDVDFDSSSLYLATTNGFYLLPYLDANLTFANWKRGKQKQFPFYKWSDTHSEAYLFSSQRARAVRYDRNHQSLFVTTKNGLYEVNRNGVEPFYIKGKEVFASSLGYSDDRLYIATINDGLWIKEGDKLQHFTTANYLFSNTILRLKVTGDHLWLFQNTGMQVFDTKTDQVLQSIDLPVIEGDNVFDVAEKDGYAYLTTGMGIYKVPLNVQVTRSTPEGFLDYVIVNNRDTLMEDGMELSYLKNDIQFFFSSPAFYDPASVSFKYRLVGADNEWQVTKPDEHMLRFSSLMPGEYIFEAIAVNKYGIQQTRPITFGFTILKPWWGTWWFITLINVLVITIVFVMITTYVSQKLRVEFMRRQISSDLHDDIGATLSSINIYTELLQEEYGPGKNLLKIQQLIRDVVTRLDDLVWSINPKNDTMEQLMNRMQHTTLPLLEASGIEGSFKYDKKLLGLEMDLVNKRNIYLMLKEMVNNVVKHADCTQCLISIKCQHPYLVISVQDNGVGFDPATADRSRSGLKNLQYRASRMNGAIKIHSAKDEGSVIVALLKAEKSRQYYNINKS